MKIGCVAIDLKMKYLLRFSSFSPLYVQEVSTDFIILYSNLLPKMGHDFLEIQYKHAVWIAPYTSSRAQMVERYKRFNVYFLGHTQYYFNGHIDC